jgi:thiol-disulfide isomerase/thioredoxin
MPGRRRPSRKSSPTILIIAGIALLLIGAFAFKSAGDESGPGVLLEAQLDQALRQGRPAVVFLHSLNCVACKEMMQTVADVYPEYQDSIALIDVDVYDQGNNNIIRRERLQSIPTLVFYDERGVRQVFIGAMPSEQFRDALAQLASGN